VIVRAGRLLSEDYLSGLAHPWSPESMPDSLQRARVLGVDEVTWGLNIVFMPPEEQVSEFRSLAKKLDLVLSISGNVSRLRDNSRCFTQKAHRR
jgi:hypothetical protein